jgi:S1-C subfamily serine protease
MSTFDLGAFSDAIADIAQAAVAATASLPRGHVTASAFHWRDGLYVTAEEAITDGEDIELTLPLGSTVTAQLLGRDASTGVALMRVPDAGAVPVFDKAPPPRAGSLVVAVGRRGTMPLASFGSAGLVGPGWRSMRGGEISAQINLAISLGRRFEGGPVVDSSGALLGMLLFGPRRAVLVMPHDNIESAVKSLEAKGHVARGYLGASLHPVRQKGARGAMIMGLDEDGPAKAAGLQLGDIIVDWDGEALHGPRDLMRRLGPASAGKPVTLGIIRGGEPRNVALTMGEKPLV